MRCLSCLLLIFIVMSLSSKLLVSHECFENLSSYNRYLPGFTLLLKSMGVKKDTYTIIKDNSHIDDIICEERALFLIPRL